jgi:hypothetical protein
VHVIERDDAAFEYASSRRSSLVTGVGHVATSCRP